MNSTAGSLLRGYMIAAMPLITSFNDVTVTAEEKIDSLKFRPVLQLHQGRSSLFVSRVVVPSMELSAGGGRLKLGVKSRNHSSNLKKGNTVNQRQDTVNSSENALAISESALYHRRVNSEFHSVFESVVKKILQETLESIEHQ